jgi:hypothetical protein
LEKNVSITATLIQTATGAAATMPFASVASGMFGVSAIAAVLMFFKPLLTGIVRALILLVKPRLTKEERAARRHVRDAQLMQRLINASNAPSQAAELRAIAARE